MQLQTIHYVNMSDLTRIFAARYYQNYFYYLGEQRNINLFKYLAEQCIIENHSFFLEFDQELLSEEYNHPPEIRQALLELYRTARPLFPNDTINIALKD